MIDYLLYYLLVFSTIFQDLVFVNFIGEFGRSLTAIITIPMAIIYFFIMKRSIFINKYIKIIFLLLLYLSLINILALFLHLVVMSEDILILDENIIIQSIKGLLYFTNIFVFILLLYNLQKRLGIKKSLKPFVNTFIFLFILLLVELYQIPNALSIIHSNNVPYNRVRLTAAESSWTSSIIVIFFSVSYYYFHRINKNMILKIVMIFIFLSMFLTSTSKGLILSCSITFLFYIFSRRNILLYILSILIIIPSILILAPKLYNMVYNDLLYYTSIITRFYTIFIGIVCIITYPFGVGNALYLDVFPKMLEKFIVFIENIGFRFNLTEIYSYINSTTSRNISVKSSLVQYGMYWGIIGTILIIIFLIGIYNRLKQCKHLDILRFNYINVILLIFFVITWDIKYDVWLFFGLINYIITIDGDILKK